MFNVTFYEKEITSTNAPQKTNNCYLHSLTNGSYMFYECSNLTTFTSNLSSLTNGIRMFSGCSNLTTFTSDLSSLTVGKYMFSTCSLTSFTSNLSSLTNGIRMFSGCSNLTTFTSDLSSLTNGEYMFYNCSFTTFNSDLSSLTNGKYMFQKCSNLTSFDTDLSSLTCSEGMFNGCPLTSFNSDLSSLTNSSAMFNNCSKLKSFTSDLSSLTYGKSMFLRTGITSFTSDLSSLTNGEGMFSGSTHFSTFISDLSSLTCGKHMFNYVKLTPQSVMYIIDSIKDITTEKNLYTDGIIPYVTYDDENKKYSATQGFMSDGSYVYTYNNPQPFTTTISASNVGTLTIAIDVTNDATTIADQLQAFAEDVTFDSWEDLKQAFVDKGWTVTWQYGGTTTSITYGLRGGEQIIPCQIFAKLVQVEDKDSAQYCTEDASSFYNIEWGHDVTDTSSYTQFNSLEDAMASWNVFPKENIISTEE